MLHQSFPGSHNVRPMDFRPVDSCPVKFAPLEFRLGGGGAAFFFLGVNCIAC